MALSLVDGIITPTDTGRPCCNEYTVTVKLHNVSKSDAITLADNIEFLIVNQMADDVAYSVTTAHVKDVR